MAEKHTYQELRKPYIFQPYPKIKYRPVEEGEEGDLKSPAYEKIVVGDLGVAQRVPEHHPYVTTQVIDEEQEKELGPEWLDHPGQLAKLTEEVKPRRGRPPKTEVQ